MDDFDAKNYWENRLRERYDLTGVGDIGLPKSYNEALYRVRAHGFRVLLNRINMALGNAAVLDIGSGTGFYVDQWLSSNVAHITATDLTQTAVNHLRENFPDVKVQQIDIGASELELEKEAFDLISAFDVLFHIVDDGSYEQAMKNFRSLLKPGGILLFSDNLLEGKEIRITHQVARSKLSVFRLLEEIGFELVFVQPMFVLMNDPIRSKSRILRKCFNTIYRIASSGHLAGKILGACLAPVDKLLIRSFSSGPSTETFIWRKI